MATARDFRRLALGLRDTLEAAHMGHPDFRVDGRIFASLNHDETRGMVVLPPEQQERLVREYPATFEPESGAWGRAGCTRVHLASAAEETLGEALTLARQDAVAKGPVRPRGRATSKTGASARARTGTRRPRSR
jgi:hypothetical protein